MSSDAWAEIGLSLGDKDVRGVPANEVRHRGICACGHRLVKHVSGRCQGVPTGRTTREARKVSNECSCRDEKPVVLVGDTRKFQLSWATASPNHPFSVALRRTDPERVEQWLVDVPLACENPECPSAAVGVAGGSAVRMVYLPGTRRIVSGFACQECVPDENGL